MNWVGGCLDGLLLDVGDGHVGRQSGRRVERGEVAVLGGGRDGCGESGKERDRCDAQDDDGEEDLHEGVAVFCEAVPCGRRVPELPPGDRAPEECRGSYHRSTPRKSASMPAPCIVTVTDCAAFEARTLHGDRDGLRGQVGRLGARQHECAGLVELLVGLTQNGRDAGEVVRCSRRRQGGRIAGGGRSVRMRYCRQLRGGRGRCRSTGTAHCSRCHGRRSRSSRRAMSSS